MKKLTYFMIILFIFSFGIFILDKANYIVQEKISRYTIKEKSSYVEKVTEAFGNKIKYDESIVEFTGKDLDVWCAREVSYRDWYAQLNETFSGMLYVGEVDVNKDGKYNCIDKALIFYIAYPGDVKFIFNNNPDKNFIHVMVAIPGPGGVSQVIVEPASHCYLFGDDYDPATFWKHTYNPCFNQDRTKDYCLMMPVEWLKPQHKHFYED